jgi:ankyrin repeat protein
MFMYGSKRYYIFVLQDGDSAVICATGRFRADILRQLVRAGSDLNLQNNVRYTDMQYYIVYNTLFQSSISNHQWGMTALMIAARNGRSDVTTILLEENRLISTFRNM